MSFPLPSTMRPIVLCPLRIERNAARGALGNRATIVCTGMGPRAIQSALDDISIFPHDSSSPPSSAPLVILFGLAGGLRTTPRAPHISKVIDTQGNAWTPTEITPAPSADTPVTLLGVDHPAPSPHDKATLAANHPNASLVDCESHVFAAIATARHWRWAIIRGVSDGPHDTLPQCVTRWVNPDGSTHIPRALADLAKHPLLLPHVIRLARRSKAALRDAAISLNRLVTHTPTPEYHPKAASELPHRGSQTRVNHQPIPQCDDANALPIPPDVRQLVIFGGTFDPPHRAHIELPPLARDAAGADWLMYIPAGRSPHKDAGPTASGADRLAMLHAALQGKDRLSISTVELARAGTHPNYTINTLEHIRTIRPDITLRLLMGADQAANFHRWRDPRAIIKLAEPLVMLREPFETWDTLRTTLREHWPPVDIDRWRARIVSVPAIHACATAIRTALAHQAWTSDTVRTMLSEPVVEYIRRAKLYRESPSESPSVSAP